MSGPFGSQQWMYSSGFYTHEIDNSARLDTNSYYTRTPSSTGNRKTWTWSGWVKKSNSGVSGIFSADPNSGYRGTNFYTRSLADGRLEFEYFNGTTTYNLTAADKLRDPSSFYHIVLAVDTTQATSTDRVKIYKNGVQLTLSGSYVPQNTDMDVNNTNRHNLGRLQSANGGGSSYFDGYLAEINFIDGQALDPTSFGEFKSGVWIPKSYSGSYGTNGYYLDFATRATDPIDASGNGNNWGSVNVASTDWMLDSPTNNFATLNPLEAGNGTYAEGNLKFSANTASVHQMTSSTASISSGKWYAEILVQALGGTYPHIGITPVATSNATYVANNGYAYRSDGNKQALAASAESYGASYTTGDIIGIAFDADSGSITFYKNGSSQGVAYSSIDTSTTWRFSNSLYSTGGISIANFGQDSSFAGTKTAQGNTDANGIGDFYYAPPSGFLALCTANLPDPAIDPARDDVPADYFNTVLYTGNGSTQSITGVGFQPDLVWGKTRSIANLHGLVDSVRGVSRMIRTNGTDAEAYVANNYVTSFDADGFSVGSYDVYNGSGTTYVAWNWLAGNGTSSNTDGTLTSTVSVNQKAGFSIVSYTGNLSSAGTATVGHGLGVEPDMIIAKGRSSSGDWVVMHRDLASWSHNLYLNLTAASTNTSQFGSRSVSASTFTTNYVTGLNVNGVTQIAYCFHSVEGFSKFGSYTGNGSTDGPFVYTGFRPAFVMIKETNTAGNEWFIYDTERDTYNVVSRYLLPNSSNAESTYTSLDILSNGFKMRTGAAAALNASGGNYIFACFAEMPFKYSNAR